MKNSATAGIQTTVKKMDYRFRGNDGRKSCSMLRGELYLRKNVVANLFTPDRSIHIIRIANDNTHHFFRNNWHIII